MEIEKIKAAFMGVFPEAGEAIIRKRDTYALAMYAAFKRGIEIGERGGKEKW